MEDQLLKEPQIELAREDRRRIEEGIERAIRVYGKEAGEIYREFLCGEKAGDTTFWR